MAAKKTSGLVLRKHANRSARRADGSFELAGVSILNEGGPPKQVSITPRKISEGKSEGWISTTGDELVVRPGGPPDDRMRAENIHLFNHYKTVVFHTVDGDVSYKVTHQPDKYVADGDDKTKVTDAHYRSGNTRVDSFYTLELEG